MGAFAVLAISVDLTKRSNAAALAYELVDSFPGTQNTNVDVATSAVTFELHFPGNLSALVRRLRNGLIPVGEVATVSLPVTSLAPDLIAAGPEIVGERVVHGAEVWDVAFDRGHYVSDARLNGTRLEATIVPSSDAMHQIYDALLTLGMVAHDPGLVAMSGR